MMIMTSEQVALGLGLLVLFQFGLIFKLLAEIRYLRKRIDDLEKRTNEQDKEISALKFRNKVLEEENSVLKVRIKDLEEENSELKFRISVLKVRIKDLEEDLRQKDAIISRQNEEINDLKKEIDAYKEKMRTMSRRFKAVSEQRLAESAEHARELKELRSWITITWKKIQTQRRVMTQGEIVALVLEQIDLFESENGPKQKLAKMKQKLYGLKNNRNDIAHIIHTRYVDQSINNVKAKLKAAVRGNPDDELNELLQSLLNYLDKLASSKSQKSDKGESPKKVTKVNPHQKKE